MDTDTPFFIFQNMGIVAFLLFFIIPIIVLVKFFILSSDVSRLRKQKSETDILILNRLEKIEKSLREIRDLYGRDTTSRPASAGAGTETDNGWSEGVSEAERREAAVLMPRLANMQGVIIKCIDSGGYEAWSKYSWEKFGNMDPGYRLIYKNYTV